MFLVEKKKNIVESDSDILVNTVNCVGVMGKGVALEFAKRYPKIVPEYKHACETGLIDIGKCWYTHVSGLHSHPDGGLTTRNQIIICFPTKRHWKNDSKLEYIEKGLDNLVEILTPAFEDNRFLSISIPKLGCGNGGLNWENEVRPLIVQKLTGLSQKGLIIVLYV